MESLMVMVAGVGGLVVGTVGGGVLAYLLADRRARGVIAALETAKALTAQQASELAGQLQESRKRADGVQTELAQTAAGLAAARAQLQASEQNLMAQRGLLDEANTRLTQAFAAVSMQSLEKNNAAFLAMAEAKFKTLSTEAAGTLEQRKAQIEGLLKPMDELLKQYQLRLGEIEKNRTESYGALQKQIGQISEVERTLTTQTAQLVSALTRPNVRGQWGEITLRRLVELSGLTARCDFVEQMTVAGEDDAGVANRLRPDMVVQLPSERCVVIDCKAVLAAFLDAAAATEEGVRREHLRRHADLIRTRAKDLATKAYWAQFRNTPEFVVLFLPGESFLYAAVEHDPTLIEDCIASRVILATPTTLIALLKTIEYGWRQEALSRNAEEIRALGVEIYDRLAVLAGHMDKVGGGLETVVGHYNAAVKSLESRLLVSARKMGELGARNEKELPVMEGVDKRPQELASTLNPEKSPLLG